MAFAFAIQQSLNIFVAENVTQTWFHISPVIFEDIIQVISGASYQLQLMPLLVLSINMSPKGVETTFYAFVISVMNVAYLLGFMEAAALAWAFSLTSDNFTNLTWFILTCSLFPIMLSFIILCLPSPPGKKRREDSEDEGIDASPAPFARETKEEVY